MGITLGPSGEQEMLIGAVIECSLVLELIYSIALNQLNLLVHPRPTSWGGEYARFRAIPTKGLTTVLP